MTTPADKLQLAKRHLDCVLAAWHEQAVSYATDVARLELLKNGIYPASRPELPRQLRRIGARDAARRLARLPDSRTERLDDEMATTLSTAIADGRKRRRGRVSELRNPWGGELL
jgi:hypothetical protein